MSDREKLARRALEAARPYLTESGQYVVATINDLGEAGCGGTIFQTRDHAVRAALRLSDTGRVFAYVVARYDDEIATFGGADLLVTVKA
jgi:hypothetical protein